MTSTQPSTRSPAQKEASRLNGRHSHGPKTEQGKERSSRNAISHGLRAVRTLLPDESPTEYQRHLDDWLASLKPGSPAEADIAANIADLHWKLERLARIEHQKVMDNLQSLIDRTDVGQMLAKLRNAEDGLTLLLERLASPQPWAASSRRSLVLLRPLACRALKDCGFVDEGWLGVLDQLLSSALPEAPQPPPPATLEQLSKLGKEIGDYLKGREAEVEAKVREVRVKFAADATMLPDDVAKSLMKGRTELERSLSRQVQLLGEVRAQVRAAAEGSGSFGQPQEPVRVRLRLVR